MKDNEKSCDSLNCRIFYCVITRVRDKNHTISKCKNCDIAKGKIKLAKFIPENEVCQACIRLRQLVAKESESRLDRIEQTEANDKALEWVKIHLPKVEQPDGTVAFQDKITVEATGDEIKVGQKLITESFSKCIGRRWAAETMDISTKVHEWLPKAVCVNPNDPGRHHAFAFKVYESVYNGQKIRFKAK